MNRLALAAVGLWATLMQVDGPALHSCPMHDAPAAQHQQHSGASTAHQHESNTPQEHHACSCLGQCCIANSVALPTPEFRGVELATIAQEVAEPRAHDAPRSAARLLPFANGPPSVAAL